MFCSHSFDLFLAVEISVSCYFLLHIQFIHSLYLVDDLNDDEDWFIHSFYRTNNNSMKKKKKKKVQEHSVSVFIFHNEDDVYGVHLLVLLLLL